MNAGVRRHPRNLTYAAGLGQPLESMSCKGLDLSKRLAASYTADEDLGAKADDL
jgi:hypothetical protein